MSQITLMPRISEKAIALAQTGVYVFDVPPHATKIEIGKAVKTTFGVDVVAVNILIQKGKPVSRRVSKVPNVTRKDKKKAMVTVKKGQTIDLFEGAK